MTLCKRLYNAVWKCYAKGTKKQTFYCLLQPETMTMKNEKLYTLHLTNTDDHSSCNNVTLLLQNRNPTFYSIPINKCRLPKVPCNIRFIVGATHPTKLSCCA